jgi:hypothetical protein
MVWPAPVLAAALTVSPMNRVLTSQGFGRVHVGMSLKRAEAALHAPLRIDNSQDPSGRCVYAYRRDGRDPGVGYMLVNGVIQRIDIELKNERSVGTAHAIGQGASVAAVLRAYGGKAEPDRTDNAKPGDLLVMDPGGKSGMRFGFEDGRLAWLIAGAYPALGFSEGCL